MFNFRWQIPGKLAGMARPFDGPGDTDLEQIRDAGVCAIISLTALPLNERAASEQGIELLHVPVPDGSPPSPGQIEQIVEFIDAKINEGKGVALHCAAGHGRTGTGLACYLVKTGLTAWEAIRQVRDKDPMAIETFEQQQAIEDYERGLDARREG